MQALYDDGSTLTTDSSGAVVAATDNSGNNIPVAPASGGITQTFSNLVTYGVQALINNQLPPAGVPTTGLARPAPAPGAAAPASALLASPAVQLIGLALLGWFLVKKVF